MIDKRDAVNLFTCKGSRISLLRSVIGEIFTVLLHALIKRKLDADVLRIDLILPCVLRSVAEVLRSLERDRIVLRHRDIAAERRIRRIRPDDQVIPDIRCRLIFCRNGRPFVIDCKRDEVVNSCDAVRLIDVSFRDACRERIESISVGASRRSRLVVDRDRDRARFDCQRAVRKRELVIAFISARKRDLIRSRIVSDRIDGRDRKRERLAFAAQSHLGKRLPEGTILRPVARSVLVRERIAADIVKRLAVSGRRVRLD